MPVELIKSPVKAFRVIGENSISTVIEEDVNVPDVNQDLYKILNCKENAIIRKCEILQDKVNITGQIDINILYAADEMGKPLCAMDTSLSFSQPIEIIGAVPNMKDFCTAYVQNIECSIINSRKINIKVILDLRCKVEDIFDVQLPGDVRGLPDIQLLREPTYMKQVAGYQKDRFKEEHLVNADDEGLNVGKILRCDCHMGDVSIGLRDGKAELQGNIEINIVYATDSEPVSVENYKIVHSFSQQMELPNATSNMDHVGDIKIADCHVTFDGTNIKVEMTLEAFAKVYNNYSMDTVADAYSQSYQMEISKDIFKVCELVGSECATTAMRDTIGVKNDMPEIELLIYTLVKPCVMESRILDDKVLVEGLTEISLIYMTSFSGEPLYSVKEEFPFKQVIDIDGARVGMICDIKCSCSGVESVAQNNQSVETRYTICCCAEVYKNTDKKILTKILETEHCKPDISLIPSLTIYMVQKGDTLWNIAKRYNTTVDALATLNKIENPNKIYPGMQLLILKNIRV